MRAVVVGRNKESLEALGANFGRKEAVLPVVVDLLGHDAAEQVLEVLRLKRIEVDLLFNCAGQGILTPFADAPLDAQRAMLRLNFEVPLELTHALLPQLRARRGAVLNIAYIAAYLPAPDLSLRLHRKRRS